MKFLAFLFLMYVPFFAHGECQSIPENYLGFETTVYGIDQQDPAKSSSSKGQSNFNSKISSDNRSFFVQFSSYDKYDNAVKRLNSLNKLIDKTIIIEEDEEKYRLISIDFAHIHEARDFLKETRMSGISCFLFRK